MLEATQARRCYFWGQEGACLWSRCGRPVGRYKLNFPEKITELLFQKERMQKEFVDLYKLEQLHFEAQIIRETQVVQIPVATVLARVILPFFAFLESQIRALAGLDEVRMQLPLSKVEQQLLITKASSLGLGQRGAVAREVVLLFVRLKCDVRQIAQSELELQIYEGNLQR
jgi:hypothetical protein